MISQKATKKEKLLFYLVITLGYAFSLTMKKSLHTGPIEIRTNHKFFSQQWNNIIVWEMLMSSLKYSSFCRLIAVFIIVDTTVEVHFPPANIGCIHCLTSLTFSKYQWILEGAIKFLTKTLQFHVRYHFPRLQLSSYFLENSPQKYCLFMDRSNLYCHITNIDLWYCGTR